MAFAYRTPKEDGAVVSVPPESVIFAVFALRAIGHSLPPINRASENIPIAAPIHAASRWVPIACTTPIASPPEPERFERPHVGQKLERKVFLAVA